MARFRAARPVRLILPRQLSSYPPRRPFLLGILNLATMAEVAMGRKITRSASVDPPGGRTDDRGSKPYVLPLLDVRFGSKADIGACSGDVCFTPESGHGSTRS